MKRILAFSLLTVALVAVTIVPSFAKEQIRIVGSSTVYPFSSYVAEELGATTKYATPVVESTGSGGGHKIFASAGKGQPDITNSSRRIKQKELKKDMAAGISKVIEIKIGFDGIAIAHSMKAQGMNLTRAEMALAVAAEVPVNGKLVKNPYQRWSDINSALPNNKIVIYGPPTSSGTRDAFEELVVQKATKKMKEYKAAGYKKGTKEIRQDGAYIPAGENDNLIVQRLTKDANAVGIFGYSFLEENSDRIKAITIDGLAPTPETVSSGKYPVSRSLFFYIKASRIGQTPGLEAYVELFLSEKMIGDNGFLKNIGLIPLPKSEREKYRAAWKSKKGITMDQLKK